MWTDSVLGDSKMTVPVSQRKEKKKKLYDIQKTCECVKQKKGEFYEKKQNSGWKNSGTGS